MSFDVFNEHYKSLIYNREHRKVSKATLFYAQTVETRIECMWAAINGHKIFNSLHSSLVWLLASHILFFVILIYLGF